MKTKTISKCDVVKYITNHKNVFLIENDMAAKTANGFEENEFLKKSYNHYKLFYQIIYEKVKSISEKNEKKCYINYLIAHYNRLTDTPLLDAFFAIFAGGLLGVTVSDLFNKNDLHTLCLFFVFLLIAAIFFIIRLGIRNGNREMYLLVFNQIKEELNCEN